MRNTTKFEEILVFDEKSTIENRNYWLENLSDELPIANIRLDYHRPESYSGKKDTVEFYLSGEVYRKLTKLANDEPLLLYAVLMATLNICLYKYSGASSIIIGSPDIRTDDGIDQPANVLAIVNNVDSQLSFRQFLLKVHNTLLEDYERQDYPYDKLIKDLGRGGVVNRCPLFDVALVLKDFNNDMPEVMNDITITFTQSIEQIKGQISFNIDLYRSETIDLFSRHLIGLLESALEDTNTLISDLWLLTEDERHQLLEEWNDTPMDYPRDKCIHQLFEAQVERTPAADALFNGDQLLSFRELNLRANKLAHYLQELGVGPNVLVGLCVYRSLEMVIGLLGVLKAGGAYVPLDPAYPKERLDAMMEDARLQVLLTTERLLDRLPEHRPRVVCLDKEWPVIARKCSELPKEKATVKDLTYVIFTSGSTGRPKGAAVYHGGWTNLLHWFTTEFNIAVGDKVLVISSFSFDITQRSLAMPLIVGGELHLMPSDFYEPELILQNIFDQKITLVNCSPSTFYPLIENNRKNSYEKLSSLRILFLGGEAISASRLRHWEESDQCRAEIVNVYGAAECTDVSSFYRLKDYQRYIETSVPIGKPIFNSQLYVLDKDLSPVPVGSTGEICIAGDGVGQGYINDKSLTMEKFVPNPFSSEPGSLLYRTGDLGRFLPDWNLEFIGRVDHQVKVRGFRIELGDIEAVLRQHETVKEAVVVDKEYSPGDRRLVAYIVPEQQTALSCQEGCELPGEVKNQENFTDRLRLFLKGKIPDYMVPNIFLVLEELPLSPNGKLDRNALPEPGSFMGDLKEGGEAPQTPTEEAVLALFSEVLKVARLGIHDDFFEIGGHSLVATEVIARINELFQVKLSHFDLLLEPTVAGLSMRIETKRQETESQA